MSNAILMVEELGKRYVLGEGKNGGYKRFSDALLEIFKPAKPQRAPANNEFWALRDVSFQIEQGDRLGVVGRNGSGKSTLLKLLSRITEPTRGRFALRGRVASLLEVGTGFHPELTGRENIFLNGAILGMSRVEIRKKLDEIVAFAEVDAFLDTPVKRFSSGMYVRLAFAVAAHLEPDVLIVDEVLAVGDAQFQKKCLGKMESVGAEGRTVIFVSHNMGAVRKLCNRGILLDKGRLIADGTSEAIANTYFDRTNAVSNFEPIAIPDLGIMVAQISINGEEGGAVFPFEPLVITIELMAERDVPDIGIQLALTKEAIDGVLFYTNTKQTKDIDSFIRRGRNIVTCRIDSFDLASGAYMLGFGIDIPNVHWHYYNLNVLRFNVHDAMYGNLPSASRYSHVYLNHSWAHELQDPG
jgi:lipopolysaccharide transport system ATP-binding protein